MSASIKQGRRLHRLPQTQGVRHVRNAGLANEKRSPPANKNSENVRHTSDTDARPPQRKTAWADAIEQRSALRRKRAGRWRKRRSGMNPGRLASARFNAPRRQRVLKGNKPHERRPATPAGEVMRMHHAIGEQVSRAGAARFARSARRRRLLRIGPGGRGRSTPRRSEVSPGRPPDARIRVNARRTDSGDYAWPAKPTRPTPRSPPSAAGEAPQRVRARGRSVGNDPIAATTCIANL